MGKIKIYPHNGLEDLEYKEILDILETLAHSQSAKDQIVQFVPQDSLKWIEEKLSEVSEYLEAMDGDAHFSPGEFEGITQYENEYKLKGYVLEGDVILKIFRILKLNFLLEHRYAEYNYEEKFPHLAYYCRGEFPEKSIIDNIENVYDDTGQIKDNATPELKRISMAMNSAYRRLNKAFNEVLSRFRNEGILTETEESIRNEKRVIAVPTEHKRSVRGIIHDSSSSGKTVFIEPESVMPINNDIFELKNDRHKEIYRIKKEISTHIHACSEQLASFQQRLIQFDIIQAKATLARLLDASKPQLNSTQELHLIEARHPLLYLKNKKNEKKTMPFELTLSQEHRILLLSGPNAGGKSILIKSVGLIQMMVQTGLLVPVSPESNISVIEKLFSDIGDHQSVDNDLSTYSSHLRTMNLVLKHADNKSLLIFDEFGTGTDPRLGGAIAEAILDELVGKLCLGVLTTHYGNLKSYAHNRESIVNGAMSFDNKELRPTYEFIAGKPGSSFTFEIATKSGLPKKIIEYAKNNAGYNQVKIEELLTDLQNQKRLLELEKLKIIEKEKSINTLKKTYAHLQEELDSKKKRVKMEVKENVIQSHSKHTSELLEVIRELREEKNLEKAIIVKKKHDDRIRKERDEVDQIQEEISREHQEKYGPIVVGSFVKLVNSDTKGKVIEIDKKNAFVQVGAFTMQVPLKKLMHTADETIKKNTPITTMDLKSTVWDDNKLDIRGLSVSESEALLEKFLDTAILNTIPHLEIIHGKGTGKLMRLVHKKLSEYKGIEEYYHPDKKQGGIGVTFVKL